MAEPAFPFNPPDPQSRDVDNTPATPFSNTPALATADVISLAEVAAKRAAKFAAMIDTLEAGPTARAAEVGRSLANVGMPRRDVVAEYGMDQGKLVMKWKDSARIIDRIVEIAVARAQKGNAFRSE